MYRSASVVLIAAVLCLPSMSALLAQSPADSAAPPDTVVRLDQVADAARLIGLEFSPAERDSMRDELRQARDDFGDIRAVPLDNAVSPALVFNPLPTGWMPPQGPDGLELSPVAELAVPEDPEDLAFLSVRELAYLIRTRQVTSMELTRLYLERLKRYGPVLECVITLTEERALEEARRADAEIAIGRYRGPLHGIPYGAKDLLSARGYPTTWGASPYREQVIDRDATVIRRLEEAGAVLVAKLTMGALAWGDVWFDGKTRNPWNLEQGASGSSAGSASATSAGLVAFAIGSETWGSIVSPSTRCGVTGLRPTYGRVSRHGAMALSWTMDKLGPICRTVEDCAIVLDAIAGPDGLDASVLEVPFGYAPAVDWSTLTIGYLAAAFEEGTGNDQAALDVLDSLGATLVPVTLPELPVYPLSVILSAEASAAFDALTRSGRDDLLVRQSKNAWPNVFRAGRFIPAVEYINANRIRTRWIEEMAATLAAVDLYVAPSFGTNLLLTNLTGHPCLVVPNGLDEDGNPVSISFTGRLFGEGVLLAVGRAWQEATGYHRARPQAYKAETANGR